MDAFTALSAQVTSLTNMVKVMTTTLATVNQIAEFSVCIMERSIYLMISQGIQLQSIMWATSIDRTRTIYIPISTTLDGGNIQTFHRGTRTSMLQHPVDRTDLLTHLVFISRIKGKETPAMINLVPWKH